jgi:acetolactate synthase-1/2/3 large subunit
MKATGAKIITFALEQIGVQYVMGIPGVHTTELYDEINNSKSINPILVTHELSAAFIADGVSRTSQSLGTILIVPAAGVTHASSGIAEAYLDGIPMLVISGGIRRDIGKSYQLHDINLEKLTAGFVKKYFCIKSHDEIFDTIYSAYELAYYGEPGPVFIEVPVEIQLFEKPIEKYIEYKAWKRQLVDTLKVETSALENICLLLNQAKQVGIYIGWGAKDATQEVIKISEILCAPVSTTLQGLSCFPFDHPLHTGMGFGNSSVPAAQNAFKNCDCLLVIGARFSELGTGSYGINVPENLIHIDINPQVFNKNYKAKFTLCGDSKTILEEIIERLIKFNSSKDPIMLKNQIKVDKEAYFKSWMNLSDSGLVNPFYFFSELQKHIKKDSYIVADDGNHTFLTAELMPIYQSKHFICPTDFNAMGYAVPASIGVKISNPDKHVVCIVGDGGLLMTGLEILTAKNQKLGILFCVFNDGELGMISGLQKIPLNRKTCSVIQNLSVEGIALATGATYMKIKSNKDLGSSFINAFKILSEGIPVILDIAIDYSNKTQFSKGVVKTNLSRFSFSEKLRFIGRAVKRHVMG